MVKIKISSFVFLLFITFLFVESISADPNTPGDDDYILQYHGEALEPPAKYYPMVAQSMAEQQAYIDNSNLYNDRKALQAKDLRHFELVAAKADYANKVIQDEIVIEGGGVTTAKAAREKYIEMIAENNERVSTIDETLNSNSFSQEIQENLAKEKADLIEDSININNYVTNHKNNEKSFVESCNQEIEARKANKEIIATESANMVENNEEPSAHTNEEIIDKYYKRISEESLKKEEEQRIIEENKKGTILGKVKGGISFITAGILFTPDADADEEFPSVENPTFEITYDSFWTKEKNVEIIETKSGFDVYVNGVKDLDGIGESPYSNGETIEEVIKNTERRYNLDESKREDIWFSKGTSSSELSLEDGELEDKWTNDGLNAYGNHVNSKDGENTISPSTTQQTSIYTDTKTITVENDDGEKIEFECKDNKCYNNDGNQVGTKTDEGKIEIESKDDDGGVIEYDIVKEEATKKIIDKSQEIQEAKEAIKKATSPEKGDYVEKDGKIVQIVEVKEMCSIS